MKSPILALRLLSILGLGLALSISTAQAHSNHATTPTGGRLLKSAKPQAEFFVTPERTVRITFLDDHGHTIAPAGQVVTVITGDRAAPTKLSFSVVGQSLVSDAPLPAGNNLPTVVQIKANADAKPTSDKFNLDFSKCSGCQKPEYACSCGH